MIIILDYGSQYTQLIARRLRELGVYAEILPFHVDQKTFVSKSPRGVILSGGPASSYQKGAPQLPAWLLAWSKQTQVPVLGICYGMQLLARAHGGTVARAAKREYGFAQVQVLEQDPLFEGLPKEFQVWMSHGDGVEHINGGTRKIAHTETAPYAAISSGGDGERWYGVQFHPEVVHTPLGGKLLENFARRICGIAEKWTAENFIDQSVAEIRKRVGKEKVLLALSGGVDSSVAAALIHKAIGSQLVCVFVDNGLLREGELERVERLFVKERHVKVVVADASKAFLGKLKGVSEPEKKRKIIGGEFIKVFETYSKKLGKPKFLAQGTLYPDVIESVSVHGPSAVIKTHHNVGGLPKRMKLELLEPFRFLFKDEVRKVGAALGLPKEAIDRHPFPGPSLAIRVMGAVSPERLKVVRAADYIVEQEVRKAGIYEKLWQAFAVLLPVKTVGVMGDERTYEDVIAVRIVDSSDGMTADWSKLPHELLARISSRIVSEVRGCNRVVYDITSKPPGTIEWE